MFTDKMDQILKGLLVSDKPDVIKKSFVAKVQQIACQPQTVQMIQGVLDVTTTFILESDQELNIICCKGLYLEWAKYNRSTLDVYWDSTLVNYLLDTKFRNSQNAVWLLHESFKLIQCGSNFDSLCQIVQGRATSFIRENLASSMVIAFCHFMHQFKACIPKHEHSANFCIAVICAVSTFSSPVYNTGAKEKDLRSYLYGVNITVGQFLNYVWNNAGQECIMQCLRWIFNMISIVDNDLQPSVALSGIVQFIPTNLINTVTMMTVSDNDITDASMMQALLRMIDWLSWPSKNIDKWVIAFLKGLATVHKYSILISVTESKVEQVRFTI